MQFSIIIPVYNAAQVLSRCIDSILAQGYTNWELILVDDGSTDDSPHICDEYATQDERIKVIHKANGGVSSARNVGLNIATGDYVTFSDADDEFYPDALQKYAECISRSHPDVVRAGYKTIFLSGKEESYSVDTDICTSDKERMLVTCESCVYYGFVWNSCIRASIAKSQTFREDICYCEDHLYIYQCMLHAKAVSIIAGVVYKHLFDDVSTNPQTLSRQNKDYRMLLKLADVERNLKSQFCNGSSLATKIVSQRYDDTVMLAAESSFTSSCWRWIWIVLKRKPSLFRKVQGRYRRYLNGKVYYKIRR